MGEPEALHPFSSNFRSQLSNVLSKPAMVSKTKQIPDEKQFLETEIDSYSGVQFENPTSSNSVKRPPTPPKPVHRTFTFDKTNPFSKKPNETSNLSLPRYAEVKKPKNKPTVPPKPLIRTEITSINTLPHAQKVPDENAKIEDSFFCRVNSLPNLTPGINQNKSIKASAGNFLQADFRNSNTLGYGHLNKCRQSNESTAPVYHLAHNDADYCDVLPDSAAYVNDCSSTPKNESRYENIYEDVNTKPTTSPVKLQPVSDMQDANKSDYTLMCSPISEINFTFGRAALYENCEMIHSPSSDVFYKNEVELSSPKVPLGDPNSVGLPEAEAPEMAPLTNDHVSPTSSFDDSSCYSVQSSMASTAASSFQRVEVCFFPPSPPPESFEGNQSGIERPASSASGSSTRPRSSGSRIPVPIKPKRQDPAKTSTSESDQQLPPTPTPSPVVRAKNGSKNSNKIVLSPPSPPGNALRSTGKGLGGTGKGARWYEKLGCIQTDTIQPSEPYGIPGERKRSKSLNREQRKSQFFLPVEPNASNPPPFTQQTG